MSFLREPDAEPIPGYRLIEPLGSGGFGEVWKCEAPGGLFKAIKFVYGSLNSLEGEAARAEQEFKAINRVKEVRHPFVLSMERIEVSSEGELLIVMELADKSLHDCFIECQAAGLVGIPRDDLLRYIRDAAEALDHMIEKYQLQHLDVKPRNLFLISDRVKVADFGLVKHLERQSSSGVLGGVTPLYAAPETFSGQISQHSDQYSLAIVYTELLTGHRPFDAKNIRQLAVQHMTYEPELRHLPEAERPVVARALAKDSAKRFPNCLAFVRALYQARSPVHLETGPAPGVETPILRPKSVADTMENMQLEMPEDDVISLDAPAPEVEPVEVSRLGLTVAQPETGALRPTLLVGLGSFGRQALVELRCRFLDRFSDLDKIPLLRFLYVDTDAEAVSRATRGAPEMALSRSDAYHLPLQPVGHYRRRMLDQLSDWLPREKLYALPRSLQTQGSRALGRLAFADNHLRFLARLRRELQQASHPDTLYESVSRTGLALRDNRPRIYVFAAAGGGSSGLLVDLGYTLRRLLQQLRQPDADINLVLLCGAPSDPATPPVEQANVYATVTELNHFCDPAISFSAQYGPDGPRVVDQGPPFTAVYLLQLGHRSPEAMRDAVAHLGSYVFHDLTTPLGLRLERSRRETATALGDTRFRSFGTYGVWFPRGLMLRLAARQACERLVEHWQATGVPTAHAEVEAACARALADPGLQFEALCARLEETTGSPEGAPAAILTTVLAKLEEQSTQAVAQDDPGNWARQALGRIQEWVGSGTGAEHESDWQKSRLSRSLGGAVQRLAADWDQRLADAAFGLMEHPGRRVAAAEAALDRFVQFCQEAADTHRGRLDQQAERTQRSWGLLWSALEDCIAGAGGFSFFGNRSRRQLRVFVDHLAAFSRQRLTEAVVASGMQFFATLRGRLQDRIRDLGFCRQRLRPLLEKLQAAAGDDADRALEVYPESGTTPYHSPFLTTEGYWEAIRGSATARVVLPEGETALEQAAGRFLQTLTPDQWRELDQAMQERVLASLGGLHHIAATSGDLTRSLGRPLVDQAAACLGALLPITDVAQVELAGAAGDTSLEAQVRQYFDRATPLVAAKDGRGQEGFVLVPASDAGRTFAETAKRAVPPLHLLKVSGQADLMFCREQLALGLEELQRLLNLCRSAYEHAASVPNSSPHARFDIIDWMPLDP
jgi:serine/threonine protein kinase